MEDAVPESSSRLPEFSGVCVQLTTGQHSGKGASALKLIVQAGSSEFVRIGHLKRKRLSKKPPL